MHAPALGAPSALSPDLTLSAQVRVRLVSLPAGTELYRRESSYFSARRPYPEWARDGGALVHEEILRCVEESVRHGTSGFGPARPGPSDRLARVSQP